MVFEMRKHLMAWIEHGLQMSLASDVYKMKIKWRLEVLGALGIVGETAPLIQRRKQSLISELKSQ